MGNCRKFKWSVTLTLDQVKVTSAYTVCVGLTTCILNHVTVASRTTEIRPFEFRQISILDEVWTLVIAFLDGNSTRKPRKGAAVIAASMHGFTNCRKFKSPDKLTLTLDEVKGRGQGHTNIHSTCRITSVPNHVTVASRSTEICGHSNVVKYRHSVKFEL